MSNGPTTRAPLPSATRKAVAAQNGGKCEKCGIGQGEIHHIRAVVDGGSNEIDNLCLLCRICHVEWHTLMSGRIDFATWIKLPPAVFLVRGLINNEAFRDDVTLAQWLEMVRMIMASVASSLE